VPALPFTFALAAGATFDPLDTWNYQYTEKAGILKLTHQATAVGVTATLAATAEQIFQESPVPAGGTAGVIPSDFDVPPVVERVKAGKRLSLLYRNNTGGAITINGMVDLTEQGGRK
jgi:hypothetical protein